ncbi:MAG: nucleotide exchange factor GrpE [Herbinix sp.]|nr:nucleotide exchange factor GrpE [Herbinix sp.]
MIDFEKELEKFDFFSVDNNLQDTHKELTNVFSEVNSTLGRIGKEQGKANIQLEELMLILDEEKEKDEVINNLKKSIDLSENEKLSVIKGLVEVLDHVENLYRLFTREENESLHQQLSLMWNLISKILLSIGITRIDDENTMFNPFLNSIAGTSSDTDLDEGIVLSVLKSGYIYKDMVLRKSEVIANKHMEAEEIDKIYEEQLNKEYMTEEQKVEDKHNSMAVGDDNFSENGCEEMNADNVENVKIEGMYAGSHNDGMDNVETEAVYDESNNDVSNNRESTYGTSVKDSTDDIVIKEVVKGYTNIHTKRQMNIPVQMKHMNVQIEEHTDVKMKECTSIQIKEHVDVQVEGDMVAQVKKHTNVCMQAMNKENTYIGNDETGVRTDETEIDADEIEVDAIEENNLLGEVK